MNSGQLGTYVIRLGRTSPRTPLQPLPHSHPGFEQVDAAKPHFGEGAEVQG
jgi:hypothetical protein